MTLGAEVLRARPDPREAGCPWPGSRAWQEEGCKVSCEVRLQGAGPIGEEGPGSSDLLGRKSCSRFSSKMFPRGDHALSLLGGP